MLYREAGGVPLRGPHDLVFDRHGGFWFSDYGKTWPRRIDRGGVYYAHNDGSFTGRSGAGSAPVGGRGSTSSSRPATPGSARPCHAGEVLKTEAGTPSRLLVVLSEGFPYDDNSGSRYAKADSRRALEELRADGIAHRPRVPPRRLAERPDPPRRARCPAAAAELLAYGVTGLIDATPTERQDDIEFLATAVADGRIPQRLAITGGLAVSGAASPESNGARSNWSSPTTTSPDSTS